MDNNVLMNYFYQVAVKAQNNNKRYRHFLTRSLPAMLAYLPGYDEKIGREVMETIANHIEGDSDIDTLTRELWDLQSQNND